MRVVVVGGGVSGLAVAWRLARSAADGDPGGDPIEVRVLEASDRLGGRIRTVDAGALTSRRPQPIDVGPDSILVRSPIVTGLLGELGLDAVRRPPNPAGAQLWVRGRLRPIPPSSVFGIPGSLRVLAGSGIVSAAGVARAAADLVRPAAPVTDPDPSIAALLRPRLGREVVANLVEPMLGGVHAGRVEQLSARSVVPEIHKLAAGGGSLLRAVRDLPPRTGAGPALNGFEGGMGALVEALEAAARAAGARIDTGASVDQLGRDPQGRLRLRTGAGEELDADHVVLAVPAFVAARLLRPPAPAAAAVAERIRYVGAATATLLFDAGRFGDQLRKTLPGNGFLVPPSQGRLMVGCTVLTTKWTQPEGSSVVAVRTMVGRDGDQRWAELDDAELEHRLRLELAEATGLDVAVPVLERVVNRMASALPQYTVGHSDRVQRLTEALEEQPGLHVTGAAYRGLGLAACLTEASALAERLVPVPTRPGVPIDR